MATVRRAVSATGRGSQSKGRAPLIFAILLLGLLLAVIGAISQAALAGGIHTTSEITASTTVLLAVTVIGLTASVLNAEAGLSDLLFWIYFVFFMAWPGWLQALTNDYPFGLRHGPENTPKAVAIVIAFLGVYATTSVFLRRKRRKAQLSPSITGSVAAPVPASLVLGFGLASAAVAAACIALVGPAVLFSNRGTVSAALTDTGVSYPYFIGKGVALAGLLTALANLRPAPGAPISWSRAPLAAVLLMETVVLFNPISNPRFQTLGVAFALISFYTLRITPLQKAAATLALGCSTLGIFAAFKKVGQMGSFELPTMDIVKRAPFSVDYDSLQQTVAGVSYVKLEGIMWGKNFLSALLFFVPRQFWADKAQPTGMIVTNALGFPYTNVSAPLPEEAYVGLSWIGVALVAALTARVVVRLEPRSSDMRGVNNLSRCFYAVLSGYAIILLRGSLSAVLPQFGVVFIVLLVAHRVGVLGGRSVAARSGSQRRNGVPRSADLVANRSAARQRARLKSQI